MAIETKATVKAYFESGDKPTEDQFSSLIDSVVFLPTGASAATTGVLEVVDSDNTTIRAIAFGQAEWDVRYFICWTTRGLARHEGCFLPVIRNPPISLVRFRGHPLKRVWRGNRLRYSREFFAGW